MSKYEEKGRDVNLNKQSIDSSAGCRVHTVIVLTENELCVLNGNSECERAHVHNYIIYHYLLLSKISILPNEADIGRNRNENALERDDPCRF